MHTCNFPDKNQIKNFELPWANTILKVLHTYVLYFDWDTRPFQIRLGGLFVIWVLHLIKYLYPAFWLKQFELKYSLEDSEAENCSSTSHFQYVDLFSKISVPEVANVTLNLKEEKKFFQTQGFNFLFPPKILFFNFAFLFP